jgi:hypothetical protein
MMHEIKRDKELQSAALEATPQALKTLNFKFFHPLF